ncbi:hypothetical protein GPECTOR_16g683 [Gonium pectorale]|uniref:Uncharacterized protein n=1 Tax=Gonium pectorale TaxID=33097 RepID=A0A150GL51_GONPE|nr:hypothetical protein GPECTOR_16g683 [Gonium pectorale]|eukprot:KXZ50508.1 hypothetical protein GPECTOR_16g683 [Gonium pectorale]
MSWRRGDRPCGELVLPPKRDPPSECGIGDGSDAGGLEPAPGPADAPAPGLITTVPPDPELESIRSAESGSGSDVGAEPGPAAPAIARSRDGLRSGVYGV